MRTYSNDFEVDIAWMRGKFLPTVRQGSGGREMAGRPGPRQGGG